MYRSCSDIVLTLDGGGSRMIFGAMQAGEPIVEPVIMPARTDSLTICLGDIVDGFRSVASSIGERKAAALSFAFPGPADYGKGIIWDLPNLPCFRGGVPLGPMLEDIFRIPVFINNDGNLFTLGEAYGGALGYINRLLSERGSHRRYDSLLGVTIGTGFGGGLVTGGRLHHGDNSCGGDLWCMRNKLAPSQSVETGASAGAVRRMYSEYSDDHRDLNSYDIYRIAAGYMDGDKDAALRVFRVLGEVAGDAVASALNVTDSLVVVGGGVSGAGRFFMQSMADEMNSAITALSGEQVSRTQLKVYNLEDFSQKEEFLKDTSIRLKVPGQDRYVECDPERKTGIILSRLTTERAVSLGAYIYAAGKLNGR